MSSSQFSPGRSIAAVVMALLLVGCAPSENGSTASRNPMQPPLPAAAPTPPPAPPPPPAASTSTEPAAPPAQGGAHGLPDFRWLVKRYGGAVVNVNVVGRRSKSGGAQLSPNDPFFEFFRRFGIPEPRQQPEQPTRALGSGFIVSPDGYVLTNAHVVGQGGEVTVKLPDRREFPARIIGADQRSDVAVLKIDGHDLPTVKFGDPSKLEPGEWVAAIGSPFGFENSVTVGVISATSRALGAESSIVPFIQTDVAVNPGNSGGPLFNLRGEVIGINSQIYSATGGYEGISFAIPIDIARNVEQQLIRTGHVTRGRLGVAIQDVSSDLAQSFGLDRPRGALVSDVDPKGPAAAAGLKPGDIILAVNGKPIEESSELPGIIAGTQPGSIASLQLWRHGQAQVVNARVARMDEDEGTQPVSSTQPSGRSSQPPQLGLSVRPLTSAERRSAQTEGHLVVESAQGAAAAAGVRPGDIILAVGDTPVNSVDDLRRAAGGSKEIALLIQREDTHIYVPVRLG